jgi:hypothetical protein
MQVVYQPKVGTTCKDRIKHILAVDNRTVKSPLDFLENLDIFKK